MLDRADGPIRLPEDAREDPVAHGRLMVEAVGLRRPLELGAQAP